MDLKRILTVTVLVSVMSIVPYTNMFAQDGVLIDYQATPPLRSASAVLELRSANQGFLAPQVNIIDLATAAPVSSPAEGLLVYNTNATSGIGYYYWNATTKWTRLITSAAAETDPTFTGAANITSAISRTGTITVSNQLTLNSTAFDNHLLLQRTGAPDAHISTSTADHIQIWPGASGDFATKGLRINNTGTGNIQLMGYGSGIVRSSATGVLSSGGNINLTTEVTGILPVGNGGSGTGTAFTPGSVIFAGTGGVYAQDNPNLFWDNTNDRLGIGTASPSVRLDIQTPGYGLPAATGSTQTSGGLRISPPTSSGNVVLDMGTNGATGTWLQTTLRTDLSNTYPLLLNPNGGNVGIGLIAPLQRLDVAGDINTTTGYRIGNTATGGQYLRGNGTRFVSSAIQVGDLPTITTAGGWTDDGAVVRLTTSTDNVGIGTTSPTNAKLQIEGSGTYDGMVRINNTGSNGASFFMGSTRDDWDVGVNKFIMGHGSPSSLNMDVTINSDGNVGINTGSPTQKLHVGGGGNLWLDGTGTGIIGLGHGIRTANRAELHLHANGVNGMSEIMLGNDARTDANVRWTISDRGVTEGKLIFYEGPSLTGNTFTERMTLLKGGNVGIGTSSPDYKLDVNGISKANEIRSNGGHQVFNLGYAATGRWYYLGRINTVVGATGGGEMGYIDVTLSNGHVFGTRNSSGTQLIASTRSADVSAYHANIGDLGDTDANRSYFAIYNDGSNNFNLYMYQPIYSIINLEVNSNTNGYLTPTLQDPTGTQAYTSFKSGTLNYSMGSMSASDATVANLAGTGNRPVFADASGTLKTASATNDGGWSMASNALYSRDDINSTGSTCSGQPAGSGSSSTFTSVTSSFSSADDGTYTVNLGFTYYINGTAYTQVTLTTNGVICFGASGTTAWSNGALPSGSFSMPALCYYWDDMYIAGSAQQRYATLGTAGNRVFILDFTLQPRWSHTGGCGRYLSGQVHIHEGSNLITVTYTNIDGYVCGQSATIGLQINATTAMSLSANTKILEDNAGHASQFVSFSPSK